MSKLFYDVFMSVGYFMHAYIVHIVYYLSLLVIFLILCM